jgi:hypothetical protein
MKSILMYKILNDYTDPNLKESLTGSSLTQANYNLRNRYTDLAPPKPHFCKLFFIHWFTDPPTINIQKVKNKKKVDLNNFTILVNLGFWHEVHAK